MLKLFWGIFPEKKFFPVHAGGSKLGKRSEKWKNFHFSSKSPNTFPKRFKNVLNMLRGSFFGYKIDQCTLEGRNLEKFEKKIDKNLEFQKCPKTVLKVSKQILNLFWGNFLGKNCLVHPGRSKLGKTSKNWKTFNFQNAEIRSQKRSNLFSTCFEVFFPVKKFA